MTDSIIRESSDLYDPISGYWVGVMDLFGREQRLTTPGRIAYPPGGLVSESNPNATLLDTGGSAGVTMTQIGFMTIPGGAMGPRSRLEVHAALTGTGGNAKTTTVRAGPASGTFATATAFGGQSGLSNQLFFPLTPLIWNNGSLASQKATPGNLPNWFSQGSNVTPLVALAIDTTLDWNIYFGVQFGTLNGGDSMTLNTMFARLLG